MVKLEEPDYQGKIYEALKLVPPHDIDQQEPVLNLGDFSIVSSEKALEASIKRRIDFCIKVAKELTKIKATDEQFRAATNRIPLTYEQYLLALKSVPKIRNDYAKIEAKSHAFDTVYLAPNDLPPFQIRNYISLPEVSDHKAMWSLIKDTSSKASETAHTLSYLYSENVLKLAYDYGENIHTADDMGYLRYLYNHDTKFYENVLRKTLPALLREEDRKRHTYIVGGTGSGKTELLKLMVHSYVTQSDYGANVVIDPHGDFVEQVSKWQDFKDNDQLIYVDPYLHKGKVPTINPLDATDTTPEEREVIAQQIVGVFEQLLKGSAGASLTVNMRTLLLPCLLVLMDDKKDCTLADLQTFLNNDHNDELVALGRKSKRKAIARFFEREFNDSLFVPTKQSVRTKLQSLFNTGTFYEMVNGKSTINLKQAIEQKKTILFNLAKGIIGNEASEALGRLVIANLQGIAIRRQNIAPEARTPVHLFIDECQNYIGESTITILEEARKYKLYLTLAQQIAGRGMSPEVRGVVLNNTNVKFSGRTAEDPRIAKLLGVELEKVQNLEVGTFFCKTGNSPTFMLYGGKAVLDDSNAMSAEDWRATEQKQAAYYRDVKDELADASKEIDLV